MHICPYSLRFGSIERILFFDYNNSVVAGWSLTQSLCHQSVLCIFLGDTNEVSLEKFRCYI